MPSDYGGVACPKPTKLDRVVAKKRRQLDEKALENGVNAIVDRRDKGRCRCCGRQGNPHSTTLLDRLHRHHLVYRSAQGEESSANKLLLCAWCHSAEHAGQMRILGTDANERLEFEIVEAAVVAIFGTRELPTHCHIVLPSWERKVS